MTSHLTVCVAREWAGVDSVREQEKLEAKKKLENAARAKRSPTRPMHLGMMAGDHFPPKNGLPGIRRASENWRFFALSG